MSVLIIVHMNALRNSLEDLSIRVCMILNQSMNVIEDGSLSEVVYENIYHYG